MLKVFIDGNVGTTGLRIEERLAPRRDISLFTLPDELRKDASARKDALNKADIAFLCLPDAAAIEAVGFVENPDTKIIDASTAHRTAEGWAYGFPELGADYRQNIAIGKRIAVPGCHASGFLSLVAPLVKQGVVPKDYPLVCYSLTGYSGGGKKMIAEYKTEGRSTEYDAPRQYAFAQSHKHLPEMQKIASLEYAPVFAPIVADYYAGMEVSVPLFARLLGKVTKADVFDALSAQYADCKFVSVQPLDASLMAANGMEGNDGMKIFVGGNDERIMLVSLFDNLGKGASGAAVQCMNIACSFDETTGLVL